MTGVQTCALPIFIVPRLIKVSPGSPIARCRWFSPAAVPVLAGEVCAMVFLQMSFACNGCCALHRCRASACALCVSSACLGCLQAGQPTAAALPRARNARMPVMLAQLVRLRLAPAHPLRPHGTPHKQVGAGQDPPGLPFRVHVISGLQGRPAA